MEELEALLVTDTQKAIKTLTSTTKDETVIDSYIKEFKKKDRTIRQSQVGKIQIDKSVGKGEKARTVKAIRSVATYQKKIVTTACAFEVGAPVTLIPENKNLLSDEVLRLWEENRIDSKILAAKMIQKSQTECAFQFYMAKTTNIEGKEVNTIKVKLLTNEEGRMSPYFDISGDMVGFTWSFNSKNVEDKDVKNVWVFTNKVCYKCDDSIGGKISIIENLPHGFDKIPIVYISQDVAEWDDVEALIDRYETGLSKLGASNDYSGYPLLKLYGTVANMPDRNEDGKTLAFPMKEVDNESGKTIHGDAEFLTNNNAPESVKLEMETLESLIYSLSATPNLSFDNLKGSIGNISGVAIKLLFIDSIIKASMNEGENRTMIQRIVKLLISGITMTTNTSLAGIVKDTVIKVQFNSILPDDLQTAVTVVSAAKTAGIMSLKTAVEYIGMNTDTEGEISMIKTDAVITVPPIV